MKRTISLFVVAVMLLSMTCATVAAADTGPSDPGVYGLSPVSGYQVTPTDADQNAITAKSVTINGTSETFYPEAVRFGLTYSGTGTTGHHLVVCLAGTNGVPTEDNIVYIDQAAAAATISFDIYPKELTNGEYSIYISKTGGTGLVKVATFSVYQSYKLGDVDGDGKITASDAVEILKYTVDLPSKVTENLRAGNTDKSEDNKVTASDAVLILKYTVDLVDENFEPIA